MPELPEHLRVAAGWVQKADNDFKNAMHTLRLEDDCPTDTVVFHAQQCVEKYLKAVLIVERIDLPRTHNLGILFDSLPPGRRPALTIGEQERLTDDAATTRYPGDYEEISWSEARRVTTLAERLREEVRGKLPRRVLDRV